MTINLNCGSILSHGRAKWTKLKIITKMMIAETMGFYADTMVKKPFTELFLFIVIL